MAIISKGLSSFKIDDETLSGAPLQRENAEFSFSWAYLLNAFQLKM
jgi:hypothetical protein